MDDGATMPVEAASGLTASRVAGRIGAEVLGVELSGGLADEVVAELRRLLLAHKVLFFRGQLGLDGDEQMAFARRLGALVPAPWPHGSAFLSEVRGKTDNWHTDMTFADAYPAFGLLCAVTVPAAGGDTLWADTASAYADLPEALRGLADTLRGVHTNEYRLVMRDSPLSDDVEAFFERMFNGTIYETEHPVVRVHPESGDRSLVLGNFLHRIQGMPRAASDHLIQLLAGYATRPECTVRWRWAVGDAVLWDNRTTMHYALGDYNEMRLLRRVSVAGEAPVGVDGRPSVMRTRTRAPAAPGA